MITSRTIAEEARIVFDELYTVEDIAKGDTIAMHKEARIIALQRIKNRVSDETQYILNSRGYKTLTDYIEDIADEMGADYETAWALYSMLGETELFDGFVSGLEDCAGMM